jgi:hypothetical protein
MTVSGISAMPGANRRRRMEQIPQAAKQWDKNDFSNDIDNASEGMAVLFDRSTKKYKNSRGDEVFFVATSFEAVQTEGFLHKGESIFNKHHESIFVPDTSKTKILLTDRDLKNLIHNYGLYADEKVNQSSRRRGTQVIKSF